MRRCGRAVTSPSSSPSSSLWSAALVAVPAGGVVGGTRAKPSSYPWFAELPFCGGALIAPDRVATAAHCVAGLPLRDIGNVRVGGTAVRAGDRHLGGAGVRAPRTGRHGQPRRSAGRHRDRGAGPPGHGQAAVAADAAAEVRYRGAPAGRRPEDGPEEGGEGRGELREAAQGDAEDDVGRRVQGVLPEAGGKTYRSAFRGATMVCATDSDGKTPFRSACSGDSGGPLVAGSTLAGIVSWGLRCGGDKDPTVFTDPTRYRSFLMAASPVLAPVSSGEQAGLTGDARVGATLTCTSPPFARAGQDRVLVRVLPIPARHHHAPAGPLADLRGALVGRGPPGVVRGDGDQRGRVRG